MIGDTSDSLIKYLRSVRDRQIQEINAIKKITILTPPPMSNLYVPLEEVKKILWKYKEEGIGHYVEEIESLPTIDLSEDKTIQTIDEMIEEKIQEDPEFQFDSDLIELQIRTLEALKLRLYPNK